MPNFQEPVTTTFIVVSIVSIFVAVAIGILVVRKVKKLKEV